MYIKELVERTRCRGEIFACNGSLIHPYISLRYSLTYYTQLLINWIINDLLKSSLNQFVLEWIKTCPCIQMLWHAFIILIWILGYLAPITNLSSFILFIRTMQQYQILVYKCMVYTKIILTACSGLVWWNRWVHVYPKSVIKDGMITSEIH